ncbi:MAG: TAT-variant-translocated molybdopterin oxidoreductase [Bdellovibrionales bacterium]|nr:TAT-variant-translocated molybdopterin oxidoreductase [Bdellovibrionales bacterium]
MEEKQFWKSLDEKYQTPEFLKTFENEFHSSPLKEEDGKDGVARRQFMKLMGASVAMSAAACVRRPVQKIIPYNKQPGEVILDVAAHYASTYFDGTQAVGIVVKTREGRPLFVGPNPGHPLNPAGISTRASAHILSLYDPDRLKGPIVNSINPKKRSNSVSVKRTWDQVDAKVTEQLKKGGVALLTSNYPSPHTEELSRAFLGKFGGTKYVWDVFNTQSVRRASKISYGSEVVPRYHFDRARYILSIDGDFLGTYLSPVEQTVKFTRGRNPDKNMSKLVSFQSVASITSLNSDDNYPIKPSQQLGVVLALISRIQPSAVPGKLKSAIVTDEQLGVAAGTLDAVAKDLSKNAGESIVIGGGLQTETENAVSFHVALNWLNSILGNDGKTISASGHSLSGGAEDLENLLAAMEAGKVKTLILHNVNPVYSLSSAYKFAELMHKVEMVVTTSNWMDETAKLCDVVAPCGHSMENWNEFEAVRGVMTIQQPTIRPLHDTRSFEDSLITWAQKAGSAIVSEDNFYNYFKSKKLKALGGEDAWFEYLQKGYQGNLPADSGRSFAGGAVASIEAPAPKEGFELTLYSTPQMADGSLNNLSWLLELPDPVTKVTWDNYLCIAPALAKEWKVKDGDVLSVKSSTHEMNVPVFIVPGTYKQSLGLAVGYGRESGGELLKGVGVNAFHFVQKGNNGSMVYSGMPVEIKKTGQHYPLAVTQGHNSMEGRQIVAETSYKAFKGGDNGIHKHKIFSIWGAHKYEGNKWGMAIDLNTCTGCSACVIACQSENNIPVVGKKYVMQGREMHWLRIDRYYKGDEAAPDAVFQPVMCQHCENAPCETVCPVLATVHSNEGLNDMVYNRCVGTRYCSNNCPYKVRRFNWFYYGDHTKTPLNMALNPKVTVRTRGVMEKCTFCVQRIKEGKNTARDENRPLKDGEIKTACEEACPTEGISFGDLNDPESSVSRLFRSQRNYTLLEEFNAAPRVRYLAKVRNTDREIAVHHGAPAGHGEEHPQSPAPHKGPGEKNEHHEKHEAKDGGHA